jgi:hypothetical protein
MDIVSGKTIVQGCYIRSTSAQNGINIFTERALTDDYIILKDNVIIGENYAIQLRPDAGSTLNRLIIENNEIRASQRGIFLSVTLDFQIQYVEFNNNFIETDTSYALWFDCPLMKAKKVTVKGGSLNAKSYRPLFIKLDKTAANVVIDGVYMECHDPADYGFIVSDSKDVTIRNCTVIGHPVSPYSYNNIIANAGTFICENNTFENFTKTGGFTIDGTGANSPNMPSLALMRGNTFKNVGESINYISENTKFIFNILPTGQHEAVMPSMPTERPWSAGDRIYNTAPVAGGSLGWICTTGGWANNNPYLAGAFYGPNDYVNTGGKVYVSKNAGNTGSTPPSHTSGDAVSGQITWTYLGTLPVFKTFGTISP